MLRVTLKILRGVSSKRTLFTGISTDGWTPKEEIQVQDQYLDKAINHPK